jgi:hypothetical protein
MRQVAIAKTLPMFARIAKSAEYLKELDGTANIR